MADKHGRANRDILEPYLPICHPNVERFVDIKAGVADRRAPQMKSCNYLRIQEEWKKYFL